MALGPGKYDDLCTYVREQAQADGAVVIVVGGKDGMGFSAQLSMRDHARLPDVLEMIARDMRRNLERGKL